MSVLQHQHQFINGIYEACWTAPGHEAGSQGAIVHGLGEHSGRYQRTVETLLRDKKIGSIRLLDFPGHGQSEGRRGDGTHGFDSYVDALDAFFYVHPELQWAWGHSMGGLAMFRYLGICKHLPGRLKMLIISAPPFELISKPNAFQKMALPLLKHTVSCLTLSTPIKSSQISSLEPEQILYAKDPRVHNKISVRVYEGMLRATEAYQEKFLKLLHRWPSLRIFLAHGELDPIASVQGTINIQQEMQEQESSLKRRVQIGLYSQSQHEIHHDRDRAAFLGDVMRFVSEAGVEGER